MKTKKVATAVIIVGLSMVFVLWACSDRSTTTSKASTAERTDGQIREIAESPTSIVRPQPASAPSIQPQAALVFLKVGKTYRFEHITALTTNNARLKASDYRVMRIENGGWIQVEGLPVPPRGPVALPVQPGVTPTPQPVGSQYLQIRAGNVGWLNLDMVATIIGPLG